MRPRRLAPLLVALLLYPLVTFAQRKPLFGTPFDAETTHRFVVPYEFHGAANISWTLSESVEHGFTRPIYSLSFLVDYMIWGTDHRGYHLTDFILSWIVLAGLLYLLQKRLGAALAIAGLSLWALHPVQAYSMFPFTGRNDRLLSLFVVAILFLFDRAMTAGSLAKRNRLMLACLATAAIGYFSKETCLPYLALAFGWGWIALERGFMKTLKQGWVLWVGGGALFLTLMLTRPLLSLGLPAEFVFGTRYFTQMGRLFFWGLPLDNAGYETASGAVLIVLLTFCFLWRRVPRSIRFGAFMTIVALAPFPFVWIQRTFLWLPFVGVGIMLAGAMLRLYEQGRTWLIKSAAVALAVVLAAGMAAWGRSEAYRISAPPIALKLAVAYMVENQSGPVYDLAPALEEYPAVADRIANDRGSPADEKMPLYLEGLVQLGSRDADAELIWPNLESVSPGEPSPQPSAGL